MRCYLRVSRDRSGREKSPNEQHGDLSVDAREQEWELHSEPYRDKVSASRYSTKAREGYDRLVADLESGAFGAHILGLWEGSRGSRRAGEWVTLVELLAEQGVWVWVHVNERLFNPSNAHDRHDLLSMALDAELEVAKTSSRLKRDAAALAREGRPTGKVPFGYRRDYAVENGKRVLTAQRPHPDEAPLIKELFARIREGWSMRSIERDWAERGVTGRAGRPFVQSQLRSMALNPAYAGWRIHAPDGVGYRHLGMAGDRTKAIWEPLISEAEFLEVTRILQDPSRRTWRPGGARHLLSMIARCDVCGHHLTVVTKRNAQRYRCVRHGCVLIKEADLDEWVVDVMVAYLSREDVYQSLRRRDAAADDKLAGIESELARLRLELDQVEAAEPSTLHEARMLAKTAEKLTGDITALEEQRSALTVPSVLTGMVGPEVDVRARWEALEDIGSRRMIMRTLLTPEALGELRVRRSPRPGRSRLPVDVADRVILLREA